jgi:hypothetical protein
VRDFVIHDFRRTASTPLHEAGFNSDWIEKALAHETKGIRGVYNRAQYFDQRWQMLQWWADFVDSQIEEERKVIIGRFGKAYQAVLGLPSRETLRSITTKGHHTAHDLARTTRRHALRPGMTRTSTCMPSPHNRLHGA